MAEVVVTKDIENKRLIVEITVNGPLETVWRAYAEKEWFEKWWGPAGWETTTKAFAFEPGGKIHYGMKCVDPEQGEWYGQYSWGVMEIEKIEPSLSFSYRDYFSDENGVVDTSLPSLHTFLTFTAENGKTKIVTLNIAETSEQLEELLNMGVIEGFTSQLEKLEAII